MPSLRRSWIALTVCLLLLANLAWAMRVTDNDSPISADERVVFFPTAAHLSANGAEWVVPVHGWIFEPEEDSKKRAALLGAFRMALGLEKDAEAAEIFRRRARAFLVDNERGQKVSVQFGDLVKPLDSSAANGHFQTEVRLPSGEFKADVMDGRVPYDAVVRPRDDRTFAGEVFLLAEEGVSVVSDIDDTIKISEVRNRKALMRRTFLQEFEVAPGMPDLYAGWKSRGASFHYVTAAPWQLYEPLSEFVVAAGYPRGTFNMKDFRFKDRTITNLWADADTLKKGAIEPLLARFPKRKFVLVGDSGERDPEIYGAIARAHQKQVIAIFIRDVTGEPATDKRYQAAFAELPEPLWRIFADPAVLKDWSWNDKAH